MTSWSSTYRAHAPGLRAFLRRRLRSAELSEDLCHEAFARAMVHEDRIRDPSRMRSYLYRIATNLVLNLKRRPDVVRPESDLGDDVDLADRPGHDPGPDDDLDAAELQRRIDTVLATLTPDQAQAFRWAVLGRMPYAEIAAHTGWSPSKVKITVFRARKRVIAALSDLRPTTIDRTVPTADEESEG
jgi:RNA polymerase sigma-70 factor (ECF subfamily)